MEITEKTRAESFKLVPRQERYKQIVECLKEREMTAHEVALRMCQKGFIPYADRNFSHPRLTELTYKGIVEVVGEKIDNWTGRKCAVYGLTDRYERR